MDSQAKGVRKYLTQNLWLNIIIRDERVAVICCPIEEVIHCK